ncbi:MAG TPA: threonine/serine dehydratase [Gammaproteobacteria bacterium]|nr:threonine/serine dehydratase [Gammaproteobacteria bacterium]
MTIAKAVSSEQDPRPLRAPGPAEIAAARVRLAGEIRRTPVLSPAALAEETGAPVLLKCEQFQVTGAFKARGALNAVRSLTPEQLARGVTTHSSGNHGQALAWAAHLAGARARIVVPGTAVATKRAAIRRWGAEVVDCGPTQKERESRLAEVVESTGALIVHPYDDGRVIAGQATATIELLEDAPRVKRILVPVGGGGLASGAILGARWLGHDIEIIGVEPAGADDTRRSLASGQIQPLDTVETVADGLRATVGQVTFPILQSGLTDLVTVTDEEILHAVRWMAETAKLVIEPSAATVIAALLNGTVSGEGMTAALISGGNVDFSGEPWQNAMTGG